MTMRKRSLAEIASSLLRRHRRRRRVRSTNSHFYGWKWFRPEIRFVVASRFSFSEPGLIYLHEAQSVLASSWKSNSTITFSIWKYTRYGSVSKPEPGRILSARIQIGNNNENGSIGSESGFSERHKQKMNFLTHTHRHSTLCSVIYEFNFCSGTDTGSPSIYARIQRFFDNSVDILFPSTDDFCAVATINNVFP